DEYASHEQHADHCGRIGGDELAVTVAHVEAELESAGGDGRYPSTEENREEQGSLGDQRCRAQARDRSRLHTRRWAAALAGCPRVAAGVRRSGRSRTGSELLGGGRDESLGEGAVVCELGLQLFEAAFGAPV